MNLLRGKKYFKNISLGLIFLVHTMVSMEQSSVSINHGDEHVMQGGSLLDLEKDMKFPVQYLDDIVSDTFDSFGNVVSFQDKYSFFIHEFSYLELGSFEKFFKKQIKKKAEFKNHKVIVTPQQIDDVVSAAERKIVRAYVAHQEYPGHIHQVILNALEAEKKVDEVEDALFRNLVDLSCLQSVMTVYINRYKELPYDFDSQDEQDFDYEDRCSLNNEIENREPLFFEALSYDNDSFIDFFIAYQVDLSYTDTSDNTLLHHAAKCNNTKVAAFLLAKDAKHLKMMTANNEFQYPLHVAAQYNADQVAIQLLQYGADVNQNANLSVHNNTPLYYAIQHNSDTVAKILIDHGAFLEDSFLNLAAQYNAYKVIPYLLAKKFQGSDKDLICALSKAAQEDGEESAEILLNSLTTEYVPVFLSAGTYPENKFHFEVRDQSMSYSRKDILYADPLFCAVLYNAEKVMQLFLRHEKINQNNILQKSNLLEVAVSHDADKIVPLLMQAGMDVHVLGYQKLNLLQRAAKNTAYKSIPLLLKAGLHVDSTMLLSCLEPYLIKLSPQEEACAKSLILATNNSCKKRKINA